MGKEKEESTRVTGRTMWDFGAEVAERLGLGILVLIGIAYGFYKYQQATESVQKQLNEAHRELRETSISIGTMNQKVVENIKGGLDTLEELQTRLKRLQEQANAESKKAEGAVAQQKKAEEARANAVNELEKVKLEHESFQKQRIARTGPFRDNVKKLIKLLQEDPSDPNVAELAEEIRHDYLVDPEIVLQTVADDPSTENLQRLEELDGLRIDVLMEIVKENKAGFASWAHYMSNRGQNAVIGIMKVSEEGNKAVGLVFLEYDSEQMRVYSVNVADSFTFVYFPSVHDWDATSAIGVVYAQGKIYGESLYGIPSDLSRGQLRLSDMIKSSLIGEDYMISMLAGEDPNIKLIALDELLTKEPATFSYLVDSEDDISISTTMMKKAERFNAASVVPITIGSGLGDIGELRSTVIECLDAAVKRDDRKRQSLAREDFAKSIWGLLAATVLQPDFAIYQIELLPNSLEAAVFCNVEDLRAMMYFRRDQALPQSQWRLTGFSPPERSQMLQKAS